MWRRKKRNPSLGTWQRLECENFVCGSNNNLAHVSMWLLFSTKPSPMELNPIIKNSFGHRNKKNNYQEYVFRVGVVFDFNFDHLICYVYVFRLVNFYLDSLYNWYWMNDSLPYLIMVMAELILGIFPWLIQVEGFITCCQNISKLSKNM